MLKLLSWSQPDKGGREGRGFQMKRIAYTKAQRHRDMVCFWQPTTRKPVELIRRGRGSGIAKILQHRHVKCWSAVVCECVLFF